MEIDYLKSFINEKWWFDLIELSKKYQDSRDDFGHTFEVVKTAAGLIEKEKTNSLSFDRNLVLAAALLHDIGWSRISFNKRQKLFSKNVSEKEELLLRLEHEKKGAELAKNLMKLAGLDKNFKDDVCRLIEGHDTRKHPVSDSDAILKDADKLWMLSCKGFQSDLRRRKLNSAQWFDILKKRFASINFIHTKMGKEEAEKRFKKIQNEYSMKKILISHYRVGWTDGVSLEIDKRKSVLEELGYSVILIAGPASCGADYVIDELDFEREDIKTITKESFLSGFSKKTIDKIEKISLTIEEKLLSIIKKEKPVFIFTHNVFSHGRHIAAAKAFASVLEKTKTPSLTTHHDFFWERDDFKNPSCNWVKNYLKTYVPPKIASLKHAVINTLAAKELKDKQEIEAMIFPDTLDFTQPSWGKDDYNCSLLKDFNLQEDDIIILQATRIVRRKGIELIPPIVKMLSSEKYFSKLKGKRLYNGKLITDKSRIVFLLAGYAEHEAEIYKNQLEKMMSDLKIEYRFLSPYIAAKRGKHQKRKVYSLFDTYPYADFISYPSLFEGWGNQFLEAVFSKTPIILYEYPVFKADIKNIGYNIVSMGGDAKLKNDGLYCIPEYASERSAKEMVNWLLSKKTTFLLEENYKLAKKYNSYDALRRLVKIGMSNLENL